MGDCPPLTTWTYNEKRGIIRHCETALQSNVFPLDPVNGRPRGSNEKTFVRPNPNSPQWP